MKKRFLKKIRVAIKKQYPSYSNEKIDEIMYGIEGLYLTFSKTIIICAISIILGLFKELICLLITFNFIRLFAFGIHASKSWICLLFSSSMFILGSFLCKYVVLPTYLLYTLYLLALIIISLYAPSDTVKRPLINKNKRIRFKILSIIVVIIYFILTIISNNNLLINSLIFGLLIECILINPIIYKIFKMPYKNYINYGLSA